jgi:hypothetical protein
MFFLLILINETLTANTSGVARHFRQLAKKVNAAVCHNHSTSRTSKLYNSPDNDESGVFQVATESLQERDAIETMHLKTALSKAAPL